MKGPTMIEEPRAFRTVLVEDEPASMNRLREALRDRREIEIVGECDSVQSAVDLLRQAKPDLVFLDIRLPDGDGFRVVEMIGWREMPAVIFVTAFDHYALRAFRVAAVDYLLKPLDDQQVDEALRRCRTTVSRWREEGMARELERLSKAVSANVRSRRLAVREAGVVRLLDLDAIRWFDALRNTTRVNTVSEGALILRRTLGDLERELDPAEFVRVHRSSIVSVRYIRELRTNEWGDYSVVLDGGQRLTVGRTYRHRLEELM